MATSHKNILFVDDDEQTSFKETHLVVPNIHFSPKDKISNFTWDNKLPIGVDCGVNTVFKHDATFGCVLNINYEDILNRKEIITGAELSPFDRCVYDAIVTLHVAGNSMFTTADIWHVISKNMKTKLTKVARQKIVKSMFHISKFWVSIVTDYSDKIFTWNNLNRDKTFKSERQLYPKLQATYTGRLLNFEVIGYRAINGADVTKEEKCAEVWKILSAPILYKYANAKGQVSSTPLNLLETSKKEGKTSALKRGTHTDELSAFLAREIDTMKRTAKRKKSYSNIILLDKLYKIDGIDDVKTDANSVNKKKSRTRDKLIKILVRFKENGNITGHKLHKKVVGSSATFHSVEIFF